MKNYLEQQKVDLVQQAEPSNMESNHFIMGQIATIDTMKNLPIIVANEIAKKIKIEEDKLKEGTYQ